MKLQSLAKAAGIASIVLALPTWSQHGQPGTGPDKPPGGNWTGPGDTVPNGGSGSGGGGGNQPPPPPPTEGYQSFPLVLSRTDKATLNIPLSISRKQFALLRSQIESTLSTIEAAYLSDEDPD